MSTPYRPLPRRRDAAAQHVTSSTALLVLGLALLIGGVVSATQTLWGLTAVALAVAVASVGAAIVIHGLARRLEQ